MFEMPHFVLVPALVLIAGCGGIFAARALRRLRTRSARREKQRVVEATARRHVQVIMECKKIIAQAKNPELIASRFDVIRDHAEKLNALAEHYDFPDLSDIKPQNLKVFYRNKKDQILHDRIIEQIDEALAAADTIPRRTGKITALEKGLILVLEGRQTMRDEALLKELEARDREIEDAIGRALQLSAE
jgi:regulator of extracellular matrix RemA (YlzA/DUF370 family)